MNIILHAHATINLAKLHERKLIWTQVLKKRERVNRLIEGTLNVCNLYKDEKLASQTKRLRNEIRLFTKGTGTTYSLDAPTERLYISDQNEQLYNANSILLKSAYRKLAMLTHPDKGGDEETFHAVNEAYRNRDLTFLQELWIALNHGNDLYWLLSEGFEYALQELERPDVNLELFRGNPMFAVNRLHTTGNKAKARVHMQQFQKSLIAKLFNELTYLKEKHHGQERQRKAEEVEEQGSRSEEVEKGRQEGQQGQGFEIGEGPLQG